MRFIQSQTSFSAGQLSRSLEGRFDIQEYRQGCKELTNMVTMKEGGARKISGYSFFSANPYQADKRLTKTWYFETKDGESIRTQIFAMDTDLVPALADNTNYVVGQYFKSGGNVYRVLQSFNSGAPASFVDTVDATVALDTYLFCSIYYSDNTTPIATGNLNFNIGSHQPFLFDGPDKTYFTGFSAAQYENTIYFAEKSGDFDVDTITVNSLSDIVIGTQYVAGVSTTPNNVPYVLNNVEGRNLVISAYTGPGAPDATKVNITFSDGAAAITQIGVYQHLHVFGSFTASGNTCYGSNFFRVEGYSGDLSTAYCSATRVVGGAFYPAAGSYDQWYKPAFGNGNYPRYVCVHEGRLVYGGTKNNPSTLFGSMVNNPRFFNNKRYVTSPNIIYSGNDIYDGDIQNLDPYVFTIATERSARINSLTSSKVLTVGTSEKCYVAVSTEGGLLGPLNVSFVPIISKAADGPTVSVDENVFLACNQGKVLQIIKYNGVNGSSDSKEASVLSKDFYTGVCRRMDVDSDNNIVFYVKADGSCHAIMNSQAGGVLAHINLDFVMNVYDVTYNYKTGNFYLATSLGDCLFTFNEIAYEPLKAYQWLHGYTFIDGTAGVGNQWSTGLTEGTEVYVAEVVAGEQLDLLQKLVIDSSGEFTFTISNTANQIVYGQSLKATICLMPVEAGQQWGSGQFGIKRVDSVMPRLYESYSFKFKEENSKYEDEKIVYDTDTNSAFTGTYEVKVDSSPSRQQVLCISNDRPEPFTVLSLTLRGINNDG